MFPVMLLSKAFSGVSVRPYLCSGYNTSDHKIQVCKNVKTYISITDSPFCLETPFYWFLMAELETNRFQVNLIHSGFYSFPPAFALGSWRETDRTSGHRGGSSGPGLSSVHAGILCCVLVPRSRQLSASLPAGIHGGNWVPIWPLI